MENTLVKLSQAIPALPLFEDNQVLTADQLNDAVTYLDLQQRSTRNRLLGAGIVCGFDVTYENTSITVSRGCGLTTDGDLMTEERSTTYTGLKEFTDKNAQYPFFINADNNTQIKLYELSKAEDATTLNAFFTGSKKATDYVVVAYLESYQKDADACSADDCDNQGRRLVEDLRMLLVSKTDLEKIKHTFPCCGSDYFDLPEIPVKRVKLTNYSSFVQLSDAYVKAINQITPEIDLAFVKAEEAYASVIACNSEKAPAKIFSFRNVSTFSEVSSTFFKETLFRGPVRTDSFTAQVQALLKEFTGKPGIQYVYDFVKDVAEAYHEFRESMYCACNCCMPDTGKFPKHLMLGELVQPDDRPPVYRHVFCKSPLFNCCDEIDSSCQFLYARLESIATSFDYKVSVREEIRITPSKGFAHLIGERAIPYYYNVPGLVAEWSPEKTKKYKSNTNLSYFANKYASDISVLQPLDHTIDKYNFLRIEGHIGKNFNTVLREIDRQVKEYDLPIHVVALKLGTDAAGTSIQFNCRFEDLDAQYSALRASLICRNKDFRDYFNSVNESKDKPIGAVDKTLEKATDKTTDKTKERTTDKTKDKLDVDVTRFFKGNETIEKTTGFISDNPQTTKFRDVNTASFIEVTDFFQTMEYNIGNFLGSFVFLLNNVPILNLPESLGSLDIEAVKKTYSSYQSFANTFKTNLYRDQTQYDFFEKEEMLNYLFEIEQDCSLEELAALKSKYDARVAEIKKQNLFSHFITKNPGLDHNCGTPLGGTFVIVYYESPKKFQPVNPREFEAVENDKKELRDTQASKGTFEKASERERTFLADDDDDKNTLSAKKNTFMATRDVPSLLNDIKTLDLLEKDFGFIADILEGVTTVVPEPTGIKDFTVIADFYLPYMCCSDCAPISYVFPEIPVAPNEEGNISLSINPGKFCDNDKTEYAVEATPAGGTAEGKGIKQSGEKFVFVPAEAGKGTHVITYKIAGGQQASITISVVEHAVAKFDLGKPQIINDLWVIPLINKSANATSYVWDFGNGETSTEEAPDAKYKPTEIAQTFKITLTAKNEVCSDTISIDTEVKPLENKEDLDFSLLKVNYAYDDKRSYQFSTEPELRNVEEVSNPDGLKLALKSGVLSFSPLAQGVKTSKQYTLTYAKEGLAESVALNIIVPDASFTMQLSNQLERIFTRGGDKSSTLSLTANLKDGKSYEWSVVINKKKIRTEAAASIKVDITGAETMTVQLTVVQNIDGVDSTNSSPVIDTIKLDRAASAVLNAGKPLDSKDIK